MSEPLQGPPFEPIHDMDDAGQPVAPWESLARINGEGRCTCSDEQLSLVGCDCPAQQNLPVGCSQCGAYLRSQEEIEVGTCGCDLDPPEREPDIWLGPEFADDVSLEERWEHYAYEERNGLSYGSSF